MSDQKSSANLLSILETDDQYALMLVNKMILTLLKSVDHNSKLAYKICSAAEGNFEEFLSATESKFPTKDTPKGQKKSYGGPPQANQVPEEDYNILVDFYQAQVEMYEKDAYQKSPFLNNLSELTTLVGFNYIQEETLSYVYAISAVDPAYRKFFEDVLHGQSSKFSALIAMAMGEEKAYSKIANYFGQSGVFVRYGIISYDSFDTDGECLPVIESFLQEQLSDHNISDEDLIDALIGKATETNLTIKDNFPHLEAQAKRIQKIVNKAYKKGKKGVNIAIYGPTGSGKTEFVKSLAKMMNKKLFAIGESESDNTEYSSKDKKIAAKRMSSLLRAQAIVKGQDDVILLMDEFEDFVSNKSDSSKQADPDSKIALNRLLEENFTVTFYNCNDIGKFHDSFQGRFFASLFVGYQPTIIRQNIWAHHLQQNNLPSDPETALSFARHYEAPPRAIAATCESVDLIDGKISDVHTEIQDKAKILRGHRLAFESSYEVPNNYDIELVSSKDNINKVQKNLQKMSKQGLPYTLLINGEKGTGKSTFAYYQAEKMIRSPMEFDMKGIVIPSRTSSPESNLAQAFMSSSNSNALLIIDNIDAMFHNISNQDQESLTELFWAFMQTQEAPVILTTKDKSLIDESFIAFVNETVAFTPMDEKIHAKAAKHMFGAPVPFKTGRAIGDFARTARSVSSLPQIANDQQTIERRIAASASANSGGNMGIKSPR